MQDTHISVRSTSKQTTPSYSRIKKFWTSVSMLINFIPKSLQRTCEPEVRRTKTVLGNPPRSYLIHMKANRQISQQDALAWWLEAARLTPRVPVTVSLSRVTATHCPRVSSETQNEGMQHFCSKMVRWQPSAWDSSALCLRACPRSLALR